VYFYGQARDRVSFPRTVRGGPTSTCSRHHRGLAVNHGQRAVHGAPPSTGAAYAHGALLIGFLASTCLPTIDRKMRGLER